MRQDVKAPLIGWHPSTVKEGSRNSNEHVLELAASFPDAFPGILASLDVHANDLNAVARYADDLAGNPKVLGFKFHPPDQGFYPTERRLYPIWEILQASRKPAMFHVGFTVLGANTDGGSGIALDYGRPVHLDMTEPNPGPLAGIRVLDLTRVLAGPYCTMFLGDLGAEVVKIEQPGVGDDTREWGPPFANGESAYFLCVNRNKKSLTIDLKTAEGTSLVRQLAKHDFAYLVLSDADEVKLARDLSIQWVEGIGLSIGKGERAVVKEVVRRYP